MEIKLVNRGDTAEVILTGRLDSSTAGETQEILNQVCDKYLNITLNMSGLRYISSAGLRVLKVIYIRVNKAGGVLTITNASPMAMEVLEMAGFASFIRIT